MKILILSNNEICYNPRLLKAADFFSDKGCQVTVFNPVTGIASETVYRKVISGKNWEILENDISKRKWASRFRWLFVSILHKCISFQWNVFRSSIGFNYYLNKGLLRASPKLMSPVDFILINLVDNLPFAAGLKKKTGGRLIYDSQEYFKGQYTKYVVPLRDWVNKAEPDFIHEVDILISTTNAMAEQLKKDYQLSIPVIRVRNLPSQLMLKSAGPASLALPEINKDTLLLVWHGMSIYFNNTRGVHILLKAVARCQRKVHLVLQGLIPAEQKVVFETYLRELHLQGKVSLLPPAEPYQIVASLRGYDVGLIGELAQEENQQLTSSNKLFDFLNAGLAVIASDLPGLNETIKEYKTGYTYPSGDYLKLAELIDSLAFDRRTLADFKKKSKDIAEKELFWEHDYDKVWESMLSKRK